MTDRGTTPQSPWVHPRPAPERDRAFREIFDGEASYVWHTLRRLGVRPADLPDVSHDVFVTVYRRLADYDTSRPLRPWVFGVAFRVASDYRRLAHHRREVSCDTIEQIRDEAPGAEQAVATREERDLVIEALESIDLEQRAVMVMHDLDGHAMPVIADALSIPINTAYSRLRLARERFRAAVQRLRKRRGDP